MIITTLIYYKIANSNKGLYCFHHPVFKIMIQIFCSFIDYFLYYFLNKSAGRFPIQNLPALLYYKVLLFLRYAAILSISPCRIAQSSAAMILSFLFRKFGPVRFAATVWWVMNVQSTVRFSAKILSSSSISFYSSSVISLLAQL